MIICYTVPEIWYKSDVIVIFHFGQFLTLLTPQKIKISKKSKKKKKKNTHGGINILHNCTKNHDHMLYCT